MQSKNIHLGQSSRMSANPKLPDHDYTPLKGKEGAKTTKNWTNQPSLNEQF